MKNYNIYFRAFHSLWKEKGAPGITWMAIALETDRKGMLCFLCICGFVLFELEIKKKYIDSETSIVNHDNEAL